MSEQATWRAHGSLGRGGPGWQKGEALSGTLEKVLWDCMFEVHVIL